MPLLKAMTVNRTRMIKMKKQKWRMILIQ